MQKKKRKNWRDNSDIFCCKQTDRGIDGQRELNWVGFHSISGWTNIASLELQEKEHKEKDK